MRGDVALKALLEIIKSIPLRSREGVASARWALTCCGYVMSMRGAAPAAASHCSAVVYPPTNVNAHPLHMSEPRKIGSLCTAMSVIP